MTQSKTWQSKLPRWGLTALVTGGYVGYAPVAPGSFGSVVGIVFVWLLWGLPVVGQIAITAALAVLGIWACDRATKLFKKADSPRIVIDEIVGMMITMLGLPAQGPWLLGGYLIFRFLDIVKFEPAGYLDRRVKRGWGVMGDDMISGVYANLLLHLTMLATV